MGKAKLEAELKLFFERRMIIDGLKEKHRLTPLSLVEGRPEEVRIRVNAYQKELEAILKQWRLDDAAQTQIQPETQSHPPRKRRGRDASRS